MHMGINLEYYKIFYSIGVCGSITAAADYLSISQPAVSQGLKQLETQLGVSLFVRTSKGVNFTSEGEALFSYIKQGYELILQGEDRILQMLNLKAGEIHIGASDMTLEFYLLPFLEKYHEKYPEIKITVTNGPTPETLQYLQEGKIDFGVVSSPIKEEYDFHIEPVKEMEDVFVAGNKFLHLKEKCLCFQDLEKLPIICLEKNTSTRAFMDNFLSEKNVTIMPEFELATSDMIVQFALRNMGIASVVRNFADKYIKNGELFVLKFEKEIPKRNFCIVTKEHKIKSIAAENLLKNLKRKQHN